jgi:hypothetical protein
MTADVAVYLGASVRLLQGVLPYRDFVFVQPPGSTVLLLPFAALAQAAGTREALALLRALTPVLAAADVLLTARALRRWGASAVALGGALVAVFPAELYALRGPMLEPFVVTLVLAAIALLAERQVAAAGLLLGLAVSVKLTALVPVAVIVVFSLRRPRQAALLLAAALAAAAVVCLPFLAAAPASFLRDVFHAQAARLTPGDAGLLRYPQYPAVLAPLLAVGLGWLAARLRVPTPAAAALAAAALALSAFSLRGLSAPDVAPIVDAAIPRGACVVTDSPRLTVTTDRFLSTKPGCSELVDPFGTSLVYGPHSALWQAALAQADYVLSDHPVSPLPPGFRLLRRDGLWIYAQGGSAF